MSGSPNASMEEEVWEVNTNMLGPPTPGNKGSRTLAASRAALSLFNQPKTPQKQVRVAANWWAPAAPNAANPAAGRPWTIDPRFYQTPQRPITKKVPNTPRKPTGAERRTRKQRKSRRNTRRLRK